MSDGPIHIALGAFGPVYYRWEIQEMIPITYPGAEEATMEPDVGQVENELIPEDATVEDSVWGLYGRRYDNDLADHIADYDKPDKALQMARNLGASALVVPLGPFCSCHSQLVEFQNDSVREWLGDWKFRGNRIASSLFEHVAETINARAHAWGRAHPDDNMEMPYKSQWILEELIKKMEEAV